jgi:hypothetical protein
MSTFGANRASHASRTFMSRANLSLTRATTASRTLASAASRSFFAAAAAGSFALDFRALPLVRDGTISIAEVMMSEPAQVLDSASALGVRRGRLGPGVQTPSRTHNWQPGRGAIHTGHIRSHPWFAHGDMHQSRDSDTPGPSLSTLLSVSGSAAAAQALKNVVSE